MGLCLLHSDLEAFQVNVPQGPLANDTVGEHPVGLLVVAGVMLDGDAPARMGLDSLSDRSSDLSADEGILGIILEVAAAQRQTVDIQSRSQPQMNPKTLHFFTNHVATLAAEIQIPALGQGRTNGHGGTVLMEHLTLSVGLLLSHSSQTSGHVIVQKLGKPGRQGHLQGIDPVLILAVILIQAQSCRAVGHDQHRHSLILKETGGLAGSAYYPHTCIAHKALAALVLETAQTDVGQLLIR
ncbi:unknown [Clostridium sp. CAG:1013]|nr:unknown [Clostridium sp. CAG:1013]